MTRWEKFWRASDGFLAFIALILLIIGAVTKDPWIAAMSAAFYGTAIWNRVNADGKGDA